MPKQIYIDSQGNEIPVSGTINNGALLPMSGSDSTSVADKISSIVESGSNANGSYIKWSDGTMICTKLATLTYASSDWSAWGSCYETSLSDCGDWAISFYVTPILNVTSTGSAGWFEYFYDNSASKVGKTRMVRPSIPGATTNYYLNITGIGRWKA